ncbi:MAG: YARHG domain-containing protein, partial [Chitinophagaceae bacterium]|nr:YARHG domain-containing protein [Chitinophagaceae bacterium]
TVYYEFFNPKAEKELEVGFEASPPAGDADLYPRNGQHPYISKFTVALNGAQLPYKVAIVQDSLYFRNGKYKAITSAQASASLEFSDTPEFFYVYHFKARFKTGLNIIQHTYTVELSSSVYEHYRIDYLLTPALRWANKQIDDFTLRVDPGLMQDVHIPHTFFNSSVEWQFTGKGKSVLAKKKKGDKAETDSTEFFIQNGAIEFAAKSFKPAGELYVCALRSGFGEGPENFDYRKQALPFAVIGQPEIRNALNDLSKRILRNLPFARRGNVFKSPELQSYFEKQKWYLRDSAYLPDMDLLLPEERAWIMKWE